MKKMIAYVLICAWLFALLDWKVIQFTRLTDRSWLEWMHAHETHYAMATRTIELIVCAPALALKPIFYEAQLRTEASEEEQDSITHAPGMSWQGFYHLPKRGESWTFVSWPAWLLYWLPISLLWWLGARRIKWLT